MKAMRTLKRSYSLPPLISKACKGISAEPADRRKKVLTLFGTRPEVIKLAPILEQLERSHPFITTINISSGQHQELLYPFIEMFGVRVDRELKRTGPTRTPDELCAWILQQLHPILDQERPDLMLVQGDTTTALAGALASVQHGIPLGHVEAGLRSGSLLSPFPEEMNRRLITRLSTYHFAATSGNRESLQEEGIPLPSIFLTGNPVVDAVQAILRGRSRSPRLKTLLQRTAGLKRIVLTTHRRESFGSALAENLKVLCRFAQKHDDVVLVFPVHPNPNVSVPANEICGGHLRVVLTEPLEYKDFIHLLSEAWLIVSDSGGVQEEAPSLGKPLLILRENTERTECIDAGIARLVGGRPEALSIMLEEAHRKGGWVESVSKVANPFGDGNSGRRIAACVAKLLRPKIRRKSSHRLPVSHISQTQPVAAI
jgi:UDP-N-acetylglucosamine 2-epimerase (non-hydrolysing)